MCGEGDAGLIPSARWMTFAPTRCRMDRPQVMHPARISPLVFFPSAPPGGARAGRLEGRRLGWRPRQAMGANELSAVPVTEWLFVASETGLQGGAERGLPIEARPPSRKCDAGAGGGTFAGSSQSTQDRGGAEPGVRDLVYLHAATFRPLFHPAAFSRAQGQPPRVWYVPVFANSRSLTTTGPTDLYFGSQRTGTEGPNAKERSSWRPIV